MLLFETRATIDEYIEKRKDIPSEILKQLISLDPTSSKNYVGKYIEWILKRYKNGNIKEEDFNLVKNLLKIFYHSFNKIPLHKRDINKYASINDLYNLVKDYETQHLLSKKERKDEIKKGKDWKIIANDDEWLLIATYSYDAWCFWSKRNSKVEVVAQLPHWCTAANKESYEEYTKGFPKYVFLNKKYNDKSGDLSYSILSYEVVDFNNYTINEEKSDFLVKKYLPETYENKKLFDKARKGDVSILSDPNVGKIKGILNVTPLYLLAMSASKLNQADVLKIIQHPDVANAKIESNGDTPLHMLARNGNISNYNKRQIRKHPAAMLVTNDRGYTPYDVLTHKVNTQPDHWFIID